VTARRRTTGTSRPGATESHPHSGDGLRRRAVNGPIKRINIPDEVLNRLTELARIPPGIGLWGPHRKFAFDVVNTIRKVHALGHILNASRIKRYKKIAHHAEELVRHLKATDERRLFALASTDTVEVIARLGRGARRAGLLANAPRQGKWLIRIREEYVEGLLDAAAMAGGRLTLDRRQEGGSLVDALRLLNPYLPQEGVLQPLSEERSFSTLRRIYDPWSARNKTVAQRQEK
jgi:hypothetical protein